MELLPFDVIEHILELLPVKSLLKFMSVSKQWKSTIQSPKFQQRQFLHRTKSQDPDVLMLSLDDDEFDVSYSDIQSIETLEIGSSVPVKFPTPWENKHYDVCENSVGGLIYLYNYRDNILVNPTTRWYRYFPPSNIQLTAIQKNAYPPAPGFGKDKINETYKVVWLYNELHQNSTTCEVFDFTTNAWRQPNFQGDPIYVHTSPYHVLPSCDPTYVDGLLYWFTIPHENETKILSFDLHTETFHIISKAPFVVEFWEDITMCNLDNQLCVSEKKESSQVIWSYDSDKTWKKKYVIDLNVPCVWYEDLEFGHKSMAVLEKNKLLFYDWENEKTLVSYDPKTKVYDLVYSSTFSVYPISYFQSLISIL